MPLVLRNEKGSPLTNVEVDDNFTYLDDKADSAQSAADTAQNTANLAGQAAQQAQDTADAAGQAADDAQSDVDTLAVQSAFEHDNLRAMLMQSRYGDGPYPIIDWQFAGASRLDPRITFSRASADTTTAANGRLITLAANEPAFPHDLDTGRPRGLRVQAQATNVAITSEFVEGIAGRTTVTSNVAVAPDGAQTMDLVTETVDNAEHFPKDMNNPSPVIDEVWCFSAFVKHNSGDRLIGIRVAGGATASAAFDPVNKTMEGFGNQAQLLDYGFEEWPDDIFRIWIVYNVVNTNTLINRLQGASKVDGFIYTGDGESGFYVWGRQVELGSQPTSYIKTDGSQVTRAADSASISGNAFTAWFNPLEGTFVLDVSGLDALDNFLMVKNSGSSYGARYQLFKNSGNKLSFAVTDSSSTLLTLASDATDPERCAFAYKNGAFTFVTQGGYQGTGDASPPPELNMIEIGRFVTGALFFRSLAYYDRALPVSRLQELMS